jgi:hypothetical protein
MPAPDAVRVIVLPVVATSVEDEAVHDVPFQTPSWKPRSWLAFGASETIDAVIDPRLAMLNACVKAPFFDNVPE